MGDHDASNDSVNNVGKVDIAIDEVDVRCGYGSSCKPDCMQRCANPKAFLVCVTLFAIVQGFAINGINNVNTSSYERRYLLDSQQSGLVSSMYDIAAGIVVLPIGYFSASAHQPRILAICLLILGLGNLTMSMAHFTAPSYNPHSEQLELMCTAGSNSTSCQANGSNQAYLKNYIYLLLFGQLLNGVAGACLFLFGITFLDLSSPAKDSALYLGIMDGGSVLGPSIGFLLGGLFLKLFVDFPKATATDLSIDDPAWVGAWWLGFIVSAILCFILSLFMFLFPRELPGTAAIRASKVSEAHDNGLEERLAETGLGLSVRDIPKTTWYLLSNPTFMCISVVDAIELMVIIGLATFLPKFIQIQFGQSVSWAPILAGLMSVPAAAGGQIISGVIIKRFDLNVSQMLKLIMGISIVATILLPVYLAKCPGALLAGVTSPYNRSSPMDGINLNSECNVGCGCSTKLYSPVCSGSMQYFSACHAGCSSTLEPIENGTKAYLDCACISHGQVNSSVSSSIAMQGKCDVQCKLLYYVFVPFAFLQFFSTFFIATPLVVTTLRVVPEKLRTYGLALHWVFLRFFGTIPGPLIFGSIMDSSCSVWEDDCSTKGSCWIYNNSSVSIRIFALLCSIKVASLLFTALAIWSYRSPQKDDLDES